METRENKLSDRRSEGERTTAGSSTVTTLGLSRRPRPQHWNGEHRRRTKVTKKMISSAVGCAGISGGCAKSKAVHERKLEIWFRVRDADLRGVHSKMKHVLSNINELGFELCLPH